MPSVTDDGAAGILRIFLRLGLTSFGGPIAHLGYLRTEFVERRRWLDESRFAQLLAVCQFLPGPASSQMVFGLGLMRGGWRGALAASLGFTLPSALLMFAFATIAPRFDAGLGAAAVHGLKLVAVVVVAHGVIGMARQLVPDLPRAAIAVATLVLMVAAGNAWLQLAAIAGGALAGWALCRGVGGQADAAFPVRHGRRAALVALGAFGIGLALALAMPLQSHPTLASIAAAFYQAGALVFGGGHVVLPLLHQGVVEPGWLSADAFLAGYGAAQAVPGPMFTLATYLGAAMPLGLPPVVGAVVATLAVFVPGYLLLVAMLPAWGRLSRHPWATGAMAGINAAVVGLLAAALYDPVWTQGVRGPVDLGVAVVGFVLLAVARVPALWVVAWCVVATMGVALAGNSLVNSFGAS